MTDELKRECRKCGAAVEINILKCPECGIHNPTMTTKQMWKGIFIISCFVFILVSVGSMLFGGSDELDLPKNVNYTILKDDAMASVKRTVEIELSQKVTKELLGKMAEHIKQGSSTTFDRTFIGYFIKGVDRSGGYWATTNYNPDLKVNIRGLSLESEKTLTEDFTSATDMKVLGIWLEDRTKAGARMTLYAEDDNTLLLEYVYADKTTRQKHMLPKQLENGLLALVDANDSGLGEYYVINTNDELEFWSEEYGNYYTAKKI